MVSHLHQFGGLAGSEHENTPEGYSPPFTLMRSLPPGLIAAPFTPFMPDGSLNLGAIPRLASLLGRNRVVGAFICGTTGEGFSLTNPERRRVADAWKNALPGKLKLIVHVGHLCLADSCELARHAQDIGADAIATIAPSFFKPPGVEELVHWTELVAAAAPRLPFYYYHMPSMTGVRISAADYLTRARGRIPTLAGVKFTDEDIVDYAATHALAQDQYDVLFGRDEILLSGLDRGATGAVGSTYNFAAPLYLEIMRATQAGDRAAAMKGQAEAQAFITVMHRHGGLPAGKAMMKMIGVDCGPVRPPLRNLTPAAEVALRAELEELGFFSYASVA